MKDGTDIDIEIQLSSTKYMAKRSLFYWSKMYLSNIESSEKYSNLKKCVTINVLDFVNIPINKAHTVYHIMEDETKYRLTDVLELHFLELPKLKDKNIIKNTDKDNPVLEWMQFINAEREEELIMLAQKNKEIKKAVNKLKIVSKDEKKKMIYEAREAELRDINTFTEEAREEGKEEGKLEVAKNLIKFGLPIEQIVEITGLIKEQIESLLDQIKVKS